MDVDRSRPGHRRDRHYTDPRQEITGFCHQLHDWQRRELLGWEATMLSHIHIHIHINLHGRRGFFGLSTRLTVIARAFLLSACHPLTERSRQSAHR